MHTITILPTEWMTTDQVAKAIRKSARTVQEMGKDGRIRSKPAKRPDSPRARLYDPKDVEKYVPDGPPAEPTPEALAKRQQRREASTSVAIRRPIQGERALDTVSIVGNLVAGHKAELEMLVGQMAHNLETVVNLILTAQKAEADANRERLKAEREDARERWELDRQDRLDRRKNRGLAIVPPPPAPKVRKAHA